MAQQNKPSPKRKKLKGYNYARSVLVKDEKIYFATSIHPFIYVRGLFVAFAGLVASLVGVQLISHFLGPDFASAAAEPLRYVAYALAGLGLFLLINAYIKQTSTEIVVTNLRVIIKFGFLSLNAFDLAMNKVDGVTISQTFAGQIFGYGNVFISTIGSSMDQRIFDVSNPDLFQRAVLKQINSLQTRHVPDGISH